MAFSTESEQTLRFAHPVLNPIRVGNDQISQTSRWIRAELQQPLVLPVFTVVASAAGQVRIEPPDSKEEWEIDFIHVRDSANIDAADIVITTLENNDYVVFIPIDKGSLNLPDAGLLNQFQRTIPNKQVTAGNDISSVGVRMNPLLVRRKNNGQSDWSVRVIYRASATVGTRNITVEVVYRRRRIE